MLSQSRADALDETEHNMAAMAAILTKVVTMHPRLVQLVCRLTLS
jgi:hypothetical protein